MIKIYLKLFVLFVSLELFASQLDLEYSQEFTDLIEQVYGVNLLSQGSTDAIDQMFAGQNLDGKKLLDIGAGLGGVDFYLAQKYAVDIIGIDCVARLVEQANRRKAGYHLLGNINFQYQSLEDYNYVYPDNYFDLILSKEVLLHVANKPVILKELFRVLKPNGKLIIIDWLNDKAQFGINLRQMMQIDGLDLKLASSSDYNKYLIELDFNDITLSILNEHYIGYTQSNIEKIHQQSQDFRKLIGELSYEYALQSWQLQKKIFEEREVLVTLIKASKPSN